MLNTTKASAAIALLSLSQHLIAARILVQKVALGMLHSFQLRCVSGMDAVGFPASVSYTQYQQMPWWIKIAVLW